MLTVVEDNLEKPCARIAGRDVSVADPFQVRLGLTCRGEASELVDQACIHPFEVFSLVHVRDGVAAIVDHVFEQPAEHASWVCRIEYPGGVGAAEEAGPVVTRRDPPMLIPGRAISPSLDPRKGALNAWPISLDPIRRHGGYVRRPAQSLVDQRWDQVFAIRE